MDLTMPSIPVVGMQKRKVQICGLPLISVVVLCDCGQAQPVVIPAVDRAGLCVGCKTQYVIARINFVNEKGQISLETEVAKWYGPREASKELAITGVANKC